MTSGAGAQPWPGAASSEIRRRLEAERVDALARMDAYRGDFRRLVDSAGSTTLDDEHDPEGATIAFERGHLDAVIAQAAQRVRDTEEALARLVAGTYGLCRTCGAAIGAARLDARPAATTCVACAAGPAGCLGTVRT